MENEIQLPFKIGPYILIKKYQNSQFLDNLLGENRIFLSHLIDNPNSYQFCKIFNKNELDQKINGRIFLKKELDVISQIKSQNVAKLLDFLETQSYIYIFTDLQTNPDFQPQSLEKLIYNDGHLQENTCVNILKQIVNAFKSLHEQSILHRNLKTENIFLCDNSIIKVSDFYFAKSLLNENVEQTICGTPYTMAPEVFMKITNDINANETYGIKADLYSVGAIYYKILFGIYPFIGNQLVELQHKKKEMNIDFNYDGIQISQLSKDFIIRALQFDQKERMSWSELYDHPLINEGKLNIISANIYNSKNLIDQFQQIQIMSQFEKEQISTNNSTSEIL